MKQKLSRLGRFVLAAACIAAAVGVGIPRCFPVPHTSAAGLAALHEERDRLAPNTDAQRDTLLNQLAARVGPPSGETRLAEFQRRLGPDWQWSETADGRQLVAALSPGRCRWDALLAAVERIEREPGLIIERLDLAASGSGPARRFTRLVITTRILRPPVRTRANPERAAALSARSRLAGPGLADPAGKVARFRLRSARRPRTPGRPPLRRLRATLPAPAARSALSVQNQRTP
ncbi:MAG: hypothetical protein JNK23_04610 [Opitutaceae bacterium]|nr:hypothetical protein [Opitutaceae bacterium]